MQSSSKLMKLARLHSPQGGHTRVQSSSKLMKLARLHRRVISEHKVRNSLHNKVFFNFRHSLINFVKH